MSLVVEKDESFNPPHISLLSLYEVMLNPKDLADLIQQFCLGIWNDPLQSTH